MLDSAEAQLLVPVAVDGRAGDLPRRVLDGGFDEEVFGPAVVCAGAVGALVVGALLGDFDPVVDWPFGLGRAGLARVVVTTAVGQVVLELAN